MVERIITTTSPETVPTETAEMLLPNEAGYERAAEILHHGGIGVLNISRDRRPWGFVVNGIERSSVEMMNRIKGRRLDQPPVMGVLPEKLGEIVDLESLSSISGELKELFDVLRLQNIFAIMPATEGAPGHLIAPETGTVAVMLFTKGEKYKPVREIYYRLLEKDPNAIIGGSSANLHGKPICYTLVEVKDQLGDKIDFIMDTSFFWGERETLEGGAPMVMLPLEENNSIVVYRGGDVFIGSNLARVTLKEGPLPPKLIEQFFDIS